MDDWWPAAPRWARIIAVTSAVALVYGTVVHLVQLAAGGLDPYPSVPDWLAAYFVSLTVLDPAAAVLLLLRRRSGLILSCAVLLTDAAANGYANYVLDDAEGITLGRIGQAVITVLAVALTAAAPRLWSSSRLAVHR